MAEKQLHHHLCEDMSEKDVDHDDGQLTTTASRSKCGIRIRTTTHQMVVITRAMCNGEITTVTRLLELMEPVEHPKKKIKIKNAKKHDRQDARTLDDGEANDAGSNHDTVNPDGEEGEIFDFQ